MKAITVTVSPEGEVEIKAVGYRGASCEKATAALERALGGTVTKKTRTPEYYQAQDQQQKAGQG